MTAAEDAWLALDAALEDYSPPCQGDERFTRDQRLPEADRQECESMCGRCLVSDLCDAFATAEHPRFGFWAGHAHNVKGKQPRGPYVDPRKRVKETQDAPASTNHPPDPANEQETDPSDSRDERKPLMASTEGYRPSTDGSNPPQTEHERLIEDSQQAARVHTGRAPVEYVRVIGDN